MKPKISDLWRISGTMDRGLYLFWGILLAALKVNLDRLILRVGGKATESIFHPETLKFYLWQSHLFPPQEHHENFIYDGFGFWVALSVLSLPFLWAGIALTLRRLRSLGWNPFWALLFFVPVVKFFFFNMLCILKARENQGAPQSPAGFGRDLMDRMIPKDSRGSAIFAIASSALLSFAAAWMGISVFRNYGFTLFVGLPFATGLLAVMLDGQRVQQTLRRSLLLANAAAFFTGVAFLLFAVEGAICLVMAAPIGLALASLGGLLGYSVQRSFATLRESPKLMCSVIAVLPMAFGVESAVPPELPLIAVRTSVVVNAPPQKVWNHVVTFSELPPPEDLIFKVGVAYPIRAEIIGTGVGAVRNCIFSTGPFVEPIEVWDEPCLLKFSVTQNPAPMQEWTPYRDVHPAHLEGYLESRQGQFKLEPMEGGRTLLEGTTWYHHHLWPAAYWQVWSDHIIHTIHLRVLNHVKQLSESDAQVRG